MQHNHCPLCLNENPTPIPNSSWQGYTTRFGDIISSGKCDKCGFVYLDPYMGPEETRRYYEEGTYRDDVAWSRGEPFDWVQHQYEQALYAHQLFYWIAQHTPDWSVSGEAAHIGADPAGSDPIADMYEYLFPGAEMESVPDIYSWDPGKKFDVIVCCQTIDHLVDPRGAIEAMRDNLDGAGLLYVDFVDFDQTQQLKWDHPSNYNRQSAIYLLRRVFGGQVVASRTFGTHFGYLVKK